MPSSPKPCPPAQPASHERVADLIEVLAGVPDPRRRRGVRHQLAVVLALGLCAVIAGARSYAAIGQWAGDLTCEQVAQLGLSRASAPDASTFRRVFARLDAGVLDAAVGAFMWTRTRTVNGRRVVAIDGKTVRGARTATGDGGTTAPHLVAALDHATGTILGQLATAAKSNEIPTVRTLLAAFDLAADGGVVVTVDAMHTQTDTADLITAAGGDYVFTVKANQPKLYAACKNLPWRDVPSHATVQTGHGRRTHRAIKVLTAPAWITFAGATQVAQVRRTTTRAGKKSVEVVYVITSADHHTAPPVVLASWIQGHWGIENRAHWVRDVTFDEDRSQVRTGAGPHVMAALRNTAISLLRLHGATNIAASLRHHAAAADRPINLLLTS
ncbi:MAG TPA: ISAs1 family transposase [Candidatus Dormibacteraeota bacterium]|nr:ISAs1 family transposase [Candidatus Dormibacteraeota bacterium]